MKLPLVILLQISVANHEEWSDYPLTRSVQMQPGAEFMKAANPAEVKGKSLFGKVLASDKEVLKVLE